MEKNLIESKRIEARDPWVAQQFSACLWPRARSWRPGIESHVRLPVYGACFSLCLCLCPSLSLCATIINKKKELNRIELNRKESNRLNQKESNQIELNRKELNRSKSNRIKSKRIESRGEGQDGGRVGSPNHMSPPNYLENLQIILKIY